MKRGLCPFQSSANVKSHDLNISFTNSVHAKYMGVDSNRRFEILPNPITFIFRGVFSITLFLVLSSMDCNFADVHSPGIEYRSFLLTGHNI